MSTHLDKIVATTRATVVAAKARVPVAELERMAAAHQLKAALLPARHLAGRHLYFSGGAQFSRDPILVPRPLPARRTAGRRVALVGSRTGQEPNALQ